MKSETCDVNKHQWGALALNEVCSLCGLTWDEFMITRRRVSLTCECGVDSIKDSGDKHSNYCPKYKKEAV